jgi:hypothetical protein
MTGPGNISAFNQFSTAIAMTVAEPAPEPAARPADKRPMYQLQNFSTRPSVNGE